MKILHITTHMGGGAGKAVAGLLVQCAKETNIEQKLLVLEIPEKLKYLQNLEQKGLEIIIGDVTALEHMTAWADVVVISWWNHPLLSELLIKIAGQKCRLALWVHVNGCSYPYLPYEFACLPEMLFVTTKYTLDNPLWSKGERDKIAEKAEMISGIGDFRPKEIKPKKEYELKGKFIAGYAGTLNYAKIHRDYLIYCQAAIQKIPDIHFLIVGDKGKGLQDEIHNLGLSDYFTFTGYVEDVYEQYARMDVMGYLLNADNYGTTENVILEAMAVGLPVVACKNGPESCILQDGMNGYLVEGPEQYAECLYRLYTHKALRQEIGKAARDFVIENYSIEATAARFLEALYKMLHLPKGQHDFQSVMGMTVYDWFKAFTGPDKPFFDEIGQKTIEEKRSFLANCPSIYKEETKSSFKHFLKYYECEELQLLSKEMK